MVITYYGQSDVGRHRNGNEDSILVGDDLFLVCDGMGGRKAGEVASRLAVTTIAEFRAHAENGFDITWPFGVDPIASLEGNCLATAIKLANRAIRHVASSSHDHTGMGTTVVAALVNQQRASATYASVGDSRIYLIRGGGISQLSRDDSWINAALSAGAVESPTLTAMRHVLTKALGTHDELEFEVRTHEFHDGDTMLLCSDGLSNMLTDQEMLAILVRRGSELEGAGRELIAAANEAGGRDNVSAVLVRYNG